MKIRTIEQLTDSLDNDLGWRQKELTSLLLNLDTVRPHQEGTAIRSALVLLYAHWEGFIKHAAESYLTYISSIRPTYKDLELGLVAYALKRKLNEFDSTNKATLHKNFVQYILSNQDDKALIPASISTASNLNSSVLQEILTVLCIDYSPFELKSHLIDEQLLHHRNTIAHGKHLLINKDIYKNLHSEVTLMIRMIRDEIQNSATLKSYLRSSPASGLLSTTA